MTSKVKILYFASLREAVGCSGEELDAARRRRHGGCVAQPPGRARRGLAGARGRAQRARGAQPEDGGADAALDGGDEVAFFPPVTGG